AGSGSPWSSAGSTLARGRPPEQSRGPRRRGADARLHSGSALHEAVRGSASPASAARERRPAAVAPGDPSSRFLPRENRDASMSAGRITRRDSASPYGELPGAVASNGRHAARPNGGGAAPAAAAPRDARDPCPALPRPGRSYGDRPLRHQRVLDAARG